ncbi:MAG: serine/threonine protein kinase [Acidobacteria bacterium]|nr:serine/threonine protein kinase [Acidobacteriota bacterium]
MSLSAGQRLGSYEIIARVGAGGMGEVYRATDTKLDRDVAIKILNRDVAADPAALRRFEQEARAVSALNHPGIVTIHDIGESEGRFYIVMELVEGATLRGLLRTEHLPLKKALRIVAQLADALAKAHESGIVHRDLKPENVMIGPDGRAKILDFGLAKLTSPHPIGSLSEASTMASETLPGTLLGTVGYMSPEQASGRAVDFRADQFAFGAVLYELATGRRAFDRKTPVETLSAIIGSEPDPPSTVNPTLPPPVAWTIERCLAKDPVDRYAATRDLARELETVRHHLADLDPARAPSLRADAKRWRSLSVIGATVGALAVGAVLSYVWFRPDQTPTLATLTFRQLTFRRGHVENAKFAPDGQGYRLRVWRMQRGS